MQVGTTERATNVEIARTTTTVETITETMPPVATVKETMGAATRIIKGIETGGMTIVEVVVGTEDRELIVLSINVIPKKERKKVLSLFAMASKISWLPL